MNSLKVAMMAYFIKSEKSPRILITYDLKILLDYSGNILCASLPLKEQILQSSELQTISSV